MVTFEQGRESTWSLWRLKTLLQRKIEGESESNKKRTFSWHYEEGVKGGREEKHGAHQTEMVEEDGKNLEPETEEEEDSEVDLAVRSLLAFIASRDGGAEGAEGARERGERMGEGTVEGAVRWESAELLRIGEAVERVLEESGWSLDGGGFGPSIRVAPSSVEDSELEAREASSTTASTPPLAFPFSLSSFSAWARRTYSSVSSSVVLF